jgi:hypothetical protein
VNPRSIVVFYQTDIKHDGMWIDKSFLCSQAAANCGSKLLWHKVVCVTSPGDTRPGRPAFTHMLAYSMQHRPDPAVCSADVLAQRGMMTWKRAMGLDPCIYACALAKQAASTAPEGERLSTVMDPFCGYGTTLVVANKMGMNAIGVERSRSRCKISSLLNLEYDSHRAEEVYTSVLNTTPAMNTMTKDPHNACLIP